MATKLGLGAAHQRHFTSGILAMVNLQAQIDGLAGSILVGDRIALLQLIALRGQIVSCIGDFEWADEAAEQITLDAPSDGEAFIARAQTRARFHRFKDALSDLDRAQRLGVASDRVDLERADVLQAIGHYDAALQIYTRAANYRGDFESFAALAILHAEYGEVSVAEPLFEKSRGRYCGVLPFAPALLDFQRGHMWLSQGDFQRARTWFETAVLLVPSYAAAQGHLAEVEAALGDLVAATARLTPLASSSDDPDYAATLSRVLTKAGRVAEARDWIHAAAVRYDELITKHPEAFADHAAEFWLEAADPNRALQLATMNLDVRQTPRARDLFNRALAQRCPSR